MVCNHNFDSIVIKVYAPGYRARALVVETPTFCISAVTVTTVPGTYCEFRFKGQVPVASPEVVTICPTLTGNNLIDPPRSLRGWVKKNYAKISLRLREIFINPIFEKEKTGHKREGICPVLPSRVSKLEIKIGLF